MGSKSDGFIKLTLSKNDEVRLFPISSLNVSSLDGETKIRIESSSISVGPAWLEVKEGFNEIQNALNTNGIRIIKVPIKKEE